MGIFCGAKIWCILGILGCKRLIIKGLKRG